jgi:hypothetical protein
MEILRKPIPELPGILEPYNTPRLPDAAQKNHVAPNTFLQSAMFGMVQRGHRNYLEKHKIYSFRNVTIYFTGGSLDQGDLDVMLHAVHLAAQQAAIRKTSGLVEFSVRGFLNGAVRFLKMEDYFRINLSKFQGAAELNSFAKICESLLGYPGFKFHSSGIYQ